MWMQLMNSFDGYPLTNKCECGNILEICSDDVIENLKNKVSCEFLDLLTQVERGYRPDYEFILEEISLLEIYNKIDNKDFILQYYLNNPEGRYLVLPSTETLVESGLYLAVIEGFLLSSDNKYFKIKQI